MTKLPAMQGTVASEEEWTKIFSEQKLPAMQAPSILLPVRKSGGQRFSVSTWLGSKSAQRMRRQVE